jgi:DUF3037 family protein
VVSKNMRTSAHPEAAWWYALVTAAPVPEAGEAINVGVLLGNGKTSHLAFRPQLPRLNSVADGEMIEALQAILESVRENVARGMDVRDLQMLIGPQLRIAHPRQLFVAPDDDVIRRLVRRFLYAARKSPVEIDEVIARSDAQLRRELSDVPLQGLQVVERARPINLYGVDLQRRAGFRVPEIARALRSFRRDVLIDSVAVERNSTTKALREATGRIGRAFWVYNKMRAEIHQLENRTIRVVGILHPSGDNPTPGAIQAREYIKHVWSADADVIDGDAVNVETALRGYADWAREGS